MELRLSSKAPTVAFILRSLLSSDIALFVHYAGREIPLESQAGEILANIGADWVINDPDYLERDAYGFTQLEVQLRIPCE